VKWIFNPRCSAGNKSSFWEIFGENFKSGNGCDKLYDSVAGMLDGEIMPQ